MPCERRTRHRFQASFRWMNSCIVWRLGFRWSSFHQYHAGLSAHRSIRLDAIADLLPGCCSLCLSTPGEASGPRIFLRILPGYAGDTSRRFVAHQATVPSRFRVQVSHRTQEPPFEFLPAALGIQRGASWRMQIPPHRNHDHIRWESEPSKPRPQCWYSNTATTHHFILPGPCLHRCNRSPSVGTFAPRS